MDEPKYGFKLNQIVLSKVELYDEKENLIPAKSKLRIVAIAPKVRLSNPWSIKNQPEYHDSKEYFYNAVRAEQKEDYGNRIRANFVTIEKV